MSFLPNKLRKHEETENSNYQGLRRVSGITIPSRQYIIQALEGIVSVGNALR